MDISTVLTWLAVVAGTALVLFAAFALVVARFVWRVHRDVAIALKEFDRRAGRINGGEFVLRAPTRRHHETFDRFLRRNSAA